MPCNDLRNTSSHAGQGNSRLSLTDGHDTETSFFSSHFPNFLLFAKIFPFYLIYVIFFILKMSALRKTASVPAKGISSPSLPSTSSGQCSTRVPLGLEDGTILDDQMTASRSTGFTPNLEAKNARLDGSTAWQCLDCDTSDWIQVDLLNCTLVEGVIIQGREDGLWDEYVSKYSVDYRMDTGEPFVFITEADGVTPVVSIIDKVTATVCTQLLLLFASQFARFAQGPCF